MFVPKVCGASIFYFHVSTRGMWGEHILFLCAYRLLQKCVLDNTALDFALSTVQVCLRVQLNMSKQRCITLHTN